jgi:hypothetical protein
MTSTQKIKIRIATDFSKVPAGRYVTDGNVSGQVFREKMLVPALSQGAHVVVDLDGTEGYGSSFLEESFGGLIRNHGFTLAQLRDQLELKSFEDPSLLVEIEEYLTEASASALSKSKQQPV